MNPVVLQFANGNAFFVGMALSIVALLSRHKSHGRGIKSLLVITCLVGICFVILSATPLSLWIYGLWLTLCAVSISLRADEEWGPLGRIIVVLFTCLSLIMCIVEVPHHLSSAITVSQDQVVFVLGDSISAGIKDTERPWPVVFGELSHLKTTNLAQPGATVESALRQTKGINRSNSLVIVEIGGNDLFAHADSGVFYAQLDKLLGSLRAENHQVAMFELPLPPFRNSFGRTQRTLAQKYQVILIPKSYLTAALGPHGGTVDGLHLSQHGHQALARSICSLLRFKQ